MASYLKITLSQSCTNDKINAINGFPGFFYPKVIYHTDMLLWRKHT